MLTKFLTALSYRLRHHMPQNCQFSKNDKLTTIICAREYARLHYPSNDEIQALYGEGLLVFKDMSIFDDFWLNQTLDTFSRQYIVPMVLRKIKIKNKVGDAERRGDIMTFEPDWDQLEACRESLREHMAMLKQAIIEERNACAKIIEDKHAEFSKRSYPPPDILLDLARQIHRRSN